MPRAGDSPRFVEPMMAQLVQQLPEGPEWSYEIKLDGYRALILKDGSRVELRSRRDNDLSDTYPTVVRAASAIAAQRVTIDGEIVAVGEDGRPSFQALQHRTAQSGHAIAFYAFDLLHLDGKDLVSLPLDERRARLRTVIAGTRLLLSDALPGTAAQVIAAVGELGLEGVIAKRRDSRYESGARTGAWRKLKLDRQQEFVVGGYRPGTHGIDALIVGYYEGRSLKYAAKVRAGFTPHTRCELFRAIEPLHAAKCPFVDLPTERRGRWGSGVTAEDMRELQWLQPQAVVQVRFVEWTADGLLRHAAFLGLRTDKTAREIQRET